MNTRLLRAFLLLIFVISNNNLAISRPDFNSDESLLNTITCPTIPAQFVNDINQCGATLTIPNPTSNDPVNCPILTVLNNVFPLQTNANGFYPVGTTTVTFTVIFAGGQATCSIDVVVDDVEGPNMFCPAAGPLICSINEEPIYTSLNELITGGGNATDNCGALNTASFIHVGDVELNPGFCPLMVERTYQISDTEGNIGSCTQTILVNDFIPPAIMCPQDISVTTTACSEVVTVITPQFSDNCLNPTIINDFNGTGNASGTYPLGTTPVLWTVTDGCGNTATCTMNVTVEDIVPPVPICLVNPSPIVQIDAMGNGIITPSLIDAGSFDNCDPMPDLSVSPTSVDCSDVGTPVLVTLTATDDFGNSSNCQTTVLVEDNIPPSITCPDITVECGDLNPLIYSSLGEFITAGGTASDNCPIVDFRFVNEIVIIVGCLPRILREYLIEDAGGNTATCSQEIIFVDTTPPTISGVGADGNYNCNTIAPVFSDPVATDVCSGQATTITFMDVVTGMNCAGGIITRTWTATDNCGNASTDSQTLTPVDNLGPFFSTLAMDMTVECDGSLHLADFDGWLSTRGGAGASDGCSMVIWSDNFTGLPVLCGGTSAATVIFTATDDCGNTSTTEATFTIEDTQGPVLDLSNVPTGTIQDVDCSVPYPEYVVTAMDACDNTSVMVQTQINEQAGLNCEVDKILFQVNYIYTATDLCGNSSSFESPTFNVIDDEDPDIVCEENLISPVSVQVDNRFPITDDPDKMINGSGLNTNDSEALHDCTTGVWGDMNNDRYLVFDLGAQKTILGVVYWLPGFPGYENMAFEFRYSEDGVNYSPIPDAPRSTHRMAIPGCPPFGAEVREFPYISTRYIEMYIRNKDFNDLIVLGEVKFLSAIELPINDGSCSFSGQIDPPDATDCSDITFTNDQTTDIGALLVNKLSPNDPPLTVIWTATDECGNDSRCEQTFVVVDEEAPSCETNGPSSVSLDGGGAAMLNLYDFNPTGSDNCTDPQDLDFYLLRMTDNCSEPDNLVEDHEVTFCCEDIGAEVMVIVRVYDEAGNSNDCMVAITVNDEIDPKVDVILPDVSISCEFMYMDLDTFGTYVKVGEPRATHTIETNTPYMDGVVSDNCSVDTILHRAVEDLECGQGTIQRIFTVIDSAGRSIEVSQIITIMDTDLFDEEDIDWPEDFTISMGCVRDSPSSSLTGEPTWPLDNCSNVGVTFSDLFFDEPTSGCPLVIRQWKVIDWCQYTSNSGSDVGIFTYDQNIFVTNSNPPEIQNCLSSLEVCMDPNTCMGRLEYELSAIDDCTRANDLVYSYGIDGDGDGVFDYTGVGDSLDLILPRGEYYLEWIVDDLCGNTSFCRLPVTVRDCKAPYAVCMNGLATDLNEMPTMGIVAIAWAIDFDASSTDNCTSQEDLIFSFSSDTDSTSRIFTCEELGEQVVEIWVTDEDGNQSHCITYMKVQDNKNLCPVPPGRISISGAVQSYTEERLSEAEVSLEFDELSMDQAVENGEYAFTDLEMYKNYKIQADMEDDYLNGVSTLDLVMIQRHILGLELLDDPYKIIAADATNSDRVDAIDLIEIRKLILGIYKEFNDAPSWRFVDASLDFPDPIQPWSYQTHMIMPQLDHSVDNMDFVGIKTGDVNGSAMVKFGGKATESRSSGEQIILRTERGSSHLVANQNMNIYGVQIALAGVEAYASIMANEMLIEEEHYVIDDGVLYLSWSDSELSYFEEGDILFSIVDNDNELTLDNQILASELYKEAYEVSPIELIVDHRDDQSGVFKVDAISPNPFTEFAQIEFSIPKEAQVSLQLIDVSGRLLYSSQHMMLAGNNSITIDKDQIQDYKGLIYCVVKYADESITRRVVRI